jgi:ABC-type lipoprotein export system ATPase subunit
MEAPERILNLPYCRALGEYPALPEFFEAFSLPCPAEDESRKLGDILDLLDPHSLEELGVDKAQVSGELVLFIRKRQEKPEDFTLNSLTILGGRNKEGESELPRLRVKTGEVVSVVGPTGSGKSRLLADIEWMAQGDTPTGRRILINDKLPPLEWRYSPERKLVAQLSQNMNFVMDLPVFEFIEMHGRSRGAGDIERKKELILREANKLAGEPISGESPVTSLSGGQSRALMIADTAFLSASPIVLIDEIENAGIDRRKAVELLIRAEKILLIATHDPILALTARRRLVIKNGGIASVLETSEEERRCLADLEAMNRTLTHCRERLRDGGSLGVQDLSCYANS